LSVKYQKSKIVFCSMWREVHRRYVFISLYRLYHYSKSASIHHMYLLSVHHSTYSKEQFLTSGISYSSLFYFIIKPSFLTKNYIIFGLWCNFDTFNYSYFCILALTTRVAETYWCPICKKLRVVTCYYFNFLCVPYCVRKR